MENTDVDRVSKPENFHLNINLFILATINPLFESTNLKD